MSEKIFNSGEVVRYNNGEISGKAIVVGIANNHIPILGIGYILKDMSRNIPNETYKYDCFVCFSTFLTCIEEMEDE